MNINEATKSFEAWLGKQLAEHGGLDRNALKLKHQAMKEESTHAFLRGTFYRWVQLWQEKGIDGPELLSVGDVHVENFGTWRDAEGRLVWGINDFDEVCPLPYTSDLVRLGVSTRLAIKELKDFETSAGDACRLILDGYDTAVHEVTTPLVLAGNNADLTKLAQQTFLATPPEKYWNKRMKKSQSASNMPSAARKLLEAALHPGCTEIEFRQPIPEDPPGMGSRGRRRFYAFALWHGARVVREVKPVIASALDWAAGTATRSRIAEYLKSANRCPDPTQQVREGWFVRRLAPDAVKIELLDLTGKGATRSEEEALFAAMGSELGRLHAGMAERGTIAKDLDAKKAKDANWFAAAVKEWTTIVEAEAEGFVPADN